MRLERVFVDEFLVANLAGMCELQVIGQMRLLVRHQRPRVLEAPGALTADELLGVGSVLGLQVVLEGRFQLVDEFALFALVVDLLGEVELLVD